MLKCCLLSTKVSFKAISVNIYAPVQLARGENEMELLNKTGIRGLKVFEFFNIVWVG